MVSAAMLVDLIGPWSIRRRPPQRAARRGAGPRPSRPGSCRPAPDCRPSASWPGELALSRTTIVAAYDRLRLAGLARSRQGSGTRVAARRPGLYQPYAATPVEHTDVEVPPDA